MPAACLLSSGFCRRVYASSASERFVSRLSHCRRRRRQRQRRRRLMSVRFAVGHGSSSTSRDDWWPSCYVLRSLFFSRFLPLLFCSLHHSRLVVPSLLFSSIPFLSFPFPSFRTCQPEPQSFEHLTFMEYLEISVSPGSTVSNQPIVSAASSRSNAKSLYLKKHLTFRSNTRLQAYRSTDNKAYVYM